MKGLTPKQREILDFIQQFVDQHHYSPSYREIMKQFAFSSPGSIYKYIQILIKKGALEAEKYSHRSLSPIFSKQKNKESSDINLPIIGNLICGYPLELFAKHQTLIVPSHMVHQIESTYVLQIQGNALIEEAILDGDYVLIEARQIIQPGEIILGLINHHDTVLKRYFPEDQSIRLEGQYSKCHPLNIKHEHIIIHGVLVGMIRLY
ncbi:MAG: transcriptional repressor LexA [Parachlamydiaceae bacterium]|nr:transcriptional repressor LexA [Parachlamydiaceae bacterium]